MTVNTKRTRGVRYRISDTEEGYTLSLLVPGWKKSELTIEAENDGLTISGKLAENVEPRPWQFAFAQRFHLPKGIDLERITATLEDGVLTLNIPKAVEVTNKRLIEVA